MRQVAGITWVEDKITQVTFEEGFGQPFTKDLILLQSSGVKDSDGKLIFDGDILKHERKKWRCHGHPNDGKDVSNLVVVEWDEEDGTFRNEVYDEKRCFCSGHGVVLFDDRAEKNITRVVGNIYQNKNLLPKSK